MAPSRIRITGARITPVAFVDPPLLNTVGVHQPYALRAIIQLDTDAGLVGLGETYADSTHLVRLQAAADAITGLDVFSLNAIHAAIADRLRGDNRAIGTAGMITTASAVDQVFSPFEVACLDIQGHATGRPVSDLLGGKVRDAVPFSAYLFYKWAAHPGQEPDTFGEALDPDGLVKQAKRIIDEYGFSAIKLKGGVFPPEEEMAAIEALHEAFPEHPLRLDPNAAWTPQTSVKVASGLAGILEYLEDPTPGLDGMAEVAQQAPMPLATNMCVVAFDQLKPAVAKGSVRVVLSDHHYWGGLQRSRLLAGICDTFGLGLSMHSNSHLGISLAAMVHLAGADPEPHLRLRYALAVEDRGDRQARRPGVQGRRGGRADDTRSGHRDRRRLAGRAARAVPALRDPRPRRHRLHEDDRSELRVRQPALVGGHVRRAGRVTLPGLARLSAKDSLAIDSLGGGHVAKVFQPRSSSDGVSAAMAVDPRCCLRCRLFRDSVQFCSGLVDLVVGVRHDLGGGHRLTLAGERFVGRLAEDIAEVVDRGAELWQGRCGQGWTAKPAMVAAGSYRPSRSKKAARTPGVCGSCPCCPSRGNCGSPRRSNQRPPAGPRVRPRAWPAVYAKASPAFGCRCPGRSPGRGARPQARCWIGIVEGQP